MAEIKIQGASQLYSIVSFLKDLFDKIILVDPVKRIEYEITQFGVKQTNISCYEKCVLRNDNCGCICSDSVSTKENRCRYIYNKTSAYLVISIPVKMKFRDYIMVLTMKLNPSFQFGAHAEAEAIDNITKLSSNLVIDPLTKIFNRKYLMDNIDYMIQTCLRERKYLSLACIDIDNFKQFNDNYGHEFGDKVLQKVAEKMVETTANLSEAYNIRIGGDEFVIVGIGVDKQRFKAVMNNLCIVIDSTKLPFNNKKVGIRISIGVGELLSDRVNNYKALYDKADTQLYAAKEAGKGCVR